MAENKYGAPLEVREVKPKGTIIKTIKGKY
jgi:hypothetical protein